MNRVDAYQLLSSELAAYRNMQYRDLVSAIGQTTSRIVRAEDSTRYTIEVHVQWRDEAEGEIIVDGMVGTADCGPLGRIDDSFVVLKRD